MNKEIKILLISISKATKYSNAGIDLIAGYLRSQGYHADIRYFHQGETYNEIVRCIPLNYDVYGMSVYSSNYTTFLKLSSYIKSNTSGFTIWGGAFPSMYYKEIFEESDDIDYIILGDGEQPFSYLLSVIEKFGEKITHDSIATKYDCDGKHNACNKEITYHAAYDYYVNVITERNYEKIHCIQTKNNVCTGKCYFCYERKGAIFYKPIDLIVDEIQYVSETFGVKKFYFADDNLLDPNNIFAKERIYELCEKIQSLNKKLVFTCYIKAISFNKSQFDHELLSLMHRTGFTTMFIGIESGNEDDLILYNKKTTVDDNINIIDLLEFHGIIPMVGFINFNPYSTLAKLKSNYEFLVNIKSNNLYSYACAFLNLYKGTEIYRRCEKDGLIKPSYTILNDLEYDFYYPEVIPIVEFLRNCLIPRIKQLKVETSWLIQRCEDCVILNPEAKKFRQDLEQRASEEFQLIKDYFYDLYVANDVDKCSNNLDNFMIHFENEVSELEKILNEIRILYKNS